MSHSTDDNCIFCKIIAGKIPSCKIADTEKCFAFLDIGPVSKGHALVLPKHHGAKLHEIPDDYLSDILPLAKKVAQAQNLVDYNVLQNNGRIASQSVDHVHFHVIPKPNESEGLVLAAENWPSKKADVGQLSKDAEAMRAKM